MSHRPLACCAGRKGVITIRALVVALLLAGLGVGVWWGRHTAPSPARQAQEAAQTPPGMVYVPGGDGWVGTDDPDADDDARPARIVFVPSFYIDEQEVTNAEYQRFASSHQYPPGEDEVPVTNLTYEEAEAYACWAGKRLPTEEEWEKAARGVDGRRYPWGNEWDESRVAERQRAGGESLSLGEVEEGCALFAPTRVRTVGSVPAGVSPYGCLDMAGNAWEWVQGFYRGDRRRRIIRGGAVGYGEHAHRTYHRGIEGAGVT